MYIPLLPRSPRPSSHQRPPSDDAPQPTTYIGRIIASIAHAVWDSSSSSSHGEPASLRPKWKRESMQDRNIMIGAIVGVVLLIFLGGLFFFLYRYHASIRLTRKRRARRYGSRSGGSSKGSHTSSDSGHPPPPPA